MSDKSNWDEAGDFIGKIGGVWADILGAKETSQPQLPASVGVTEPVTTQQPTTQTPIATVTPALDNKTLLMLGGGVLVVMLLMLTMTRGR
ncbi:hypothetical protein [Terasakiella pusilla]|uniref:hypothetical protein n=1 Tax=Terasakiella pusilla TaxID=64973 RepID=UPI003AA97974